MAESSYKVKVKFCGNCNPTIDAGQTFKHIKEQIRAIIPHVDFVPSGAPDASVLLIVSGCATDCAQRPEGSRTEVVVAGETVNRNVCPIEDIPTEVVLALTSIVNQSKLE